MNLYPVFMPGLALRLEKQGFPVIKIEPNKKRPQFNVYYFNDTVEFHRALCEAMAARKLSRAAFKSE